MQQANKRWKGDQMHSKNPQDKKPGLAKAPQAKHPADLDDGKGDELVREFRALHHGTKIIAASSHDAGNTALMKTGASAVCGKMEFDKIAQVIKRLEIESAD